MMRKFAPRLCGDIAKAQAAAGSLHDALATARGIVDDAFGTAESLADVAEMLDGGRGFAGGAEPY